MTKAWLDAVAGGVHNVRDILQFVLKDLHDWDRNIQGELERKISKVRKELEGCRRKQISQSCASCEHVLQYKMKHLQEQLNIYSKQQLILCGSQRLTETQNSPMLQPQRGRGGIGLRSRLMRMGEK